MCRVWLLPEERDGGDGGVDACMDVSLTAPRAPLQSTKQHLGISIVGLASPHAGSNSDRFMDRIPPPLRVPLTVAFYMVAGLTLWY